MKRVLLLLAIAGLATTSVVAQEIKQAPAPQQTPTTTQPPQQDPKQQRAEWDKKIKTELNLTAEQVVKFDALSKEYHEKIEALQKDATLTADVQKEKKMALKKEKEAKLFEFLTPEQQTKYKDLIEKKKAADKPTGN
jgi:Spy/CpxP family protein refolding chaperone